MNKSKAPKWFSKCNLKQTDIFTSFQNWQSIERDKKKRKMALTREVIVIEDSDSESESTTVSPSPNDGWPRKKRQLIEPFSDEEDKQGIITDQPLKPVATNFLPKIKRPLECDFFDSEEEAECKKSDAGSGETVTPTKIKENTINIPRGDLTYPVACSTPLPISNTCTLDALNTHVGRDDILGISQIDSSDINDDSESSTDSERTVIVQCRSSTEGKITVTENLIIATSRHSSSNKSFDSPSKKRCAEQKKDTKKLKTSHENSSCSSKVVSTPQKNEASTSDNSQQTKATAGNVERDGSRGHKSETKKLKTKRRNIGGSKRKSTADTAEANASNSSQLRKTTASDGKTGNPQELGKEVSTLTKKWLIKKEKRNCDESQRNSLNFGIPNKNGQKSVHGKPESVKKSPQSDKNAPKMSKENIPSCSKYIGSEGSPKASPKSAKSRGNPGKTRDVTGMSPNKSFKAKKEEKKMNKEPLLLITELFKTVFSSTHVNNLLETERQAIKMFFDMDFRYQYACLKLITWERKWYNAYKFCERIYLDMEDTDISDMVEFFDQEGIIETDYTKESAEHLLPRLNNTEIRGICNGFKLRKTLKRKEEMISHLLKYSNTQFTLTVQKTTKDLLKDEIQRRMGRCMRVSEFFKNAFYSTFVLGTYTNPRFSSISEYFHSVLYQKVMFPEYSINDYIIFSSRNDFIRYVEARKYYDEVENCKDHLTSLQICETVFAKLKALENHNDEERFLDAPHLIRFTERAVYVSALSFMVDKLYCKFPNQVKMWLEYMIKKVDYPHKIGHWYYHLIWLYMKYLKPLNYDHAAELLVEVLHCKKKYLSEVQLYQLRQRGEQLVCTRKYKILQMNHDLIVHLLPRCLKVEEFPETTVDARTIRSNDLGMKRNYEVRDAEGNKTIFKVEDIALKHYLEHGYTGGEHWEGAFVKATFTLLFFDIIYEPANFIPGTFVSKVQSEPLDMNTRYFYSNRREQIDRRLKEIESEWSDTGFMKFLKDKYERHSHEFAVCEVGQIIKDADLLEVLVRCVGRKVLAGIYERLVKDFKAYRSGLPDLLVWNADRKDCKFVEVKGENDRLSVGQTLWLHHLRKIGANVEVCHVHSIGSKRKVKKVTGKDLKEASTSSSPDKKS